MAIAIHDSTYLIDFSVNTLSLEDGIEIEDSIADHIISELKSYEHEHLAKFIGAGIPDELVHRSPKLCSRLWLELDIVPITLELGVKDREYWDLKCVDEQADSMARKCIMCVFLCFTSLKS